MNGNICRGGGQDGGVGGGDLSNIEFAPFLNGGQLLKERICCSKSKFFNLRVDPFSGGFHILGKHTGSQESCSPLQMSKQHGGVLIHINTLKV